jgi:hypothetical protein
VRVGDLKAAFEAGMTIITEAKAASQGSEKQVVWPVVVASGPGKVLEASVEKLAFLRDGAARTVSYRLKRKGGVQLKPALKAGERADIDQVLAAVVPVTRRVPLGERAGVGHYIAELDSVNERVRFAAAKALSGFRDERADRALRGRLADAQEHIFVRLEAAASLARHGIQDGWTFFEKTLSDQFAENRLESCIVLAELDDEGARYQLMAKLADDAEHVDVRAGAAWALGEHRSAIGMRALAEAFTSRRIEIRVEAARALTKLARANRLDAVGLFGEVPDVSRPAVAFALRRGAHATVSELLGSMKSDDMRQWVAYVIGTGEDIHEIEQLREVDREVYFAATVLWKMLTSGIYHLEEFG